MLEFNTQLFELLAELRNIPGIGLLADVPIFFLPVFLTTMWLYFTFKKQDDAIKKQDDAMRYKLLHIFYGCVIGVLLSYFIKLFVEIERPDAYMQEAGSLIMSALPEKSFPSEHANVSFAFVTGLFLYGFKKTALTFLPFVIVMNIARIITGVHWPLDIIAGMIVGICAAYINYAYISQLKFVKRLNLIIIQIMKTLKLY